MTQTKQLLGACLNVTQLILEPKCYSTNGLGLWLSPVSEKEKQNKNLFQEKVFFFKKKCCPSIWAKTSSRHLPHNKENFLCWFSPSFVCSFLVGIYLCILYLCIINLRSRIGCFLCRWKQIASQMAELVERVHHDLKVMGSISAKVQF